jgi:hypothetical protein
MAVLPRVRSVVGVKRPAPDLECRPELSRSSQRRSVFVLVFIPLAPALAALRSGLLAAHLLHLRSTLLLHLRGALLLHLSGALLLHLISLLLHLRGPLLLHLSSTPLLLLHIRLALLLAGLCRTLTLLCRTLTLRFNCALLLGLGAPLLHLLLLLLLTAFRGFAGILLGSALAGGGLLRSLLAICAGGGALLLLSPLLSLLVLSRSIVLGGPAGILPAPRFRRGAVSVHLTPGLICESLLAGGFRSLPLLDLRGALFSLPLFSSLALRGVPLLATRSDIAVRLNSGAEALPFRLTLFLALPRAGFFLLSSAAACRRSRALRRLS